uniref:Uncharacterized protein AlNc14C104G6152 n=1 Tax=Albugo laibachii Nc14 TaxID=890382 RepID=F0WHU5_9STRA|nr:conserved hypothetical protein [Albugo laibachii Nc14]|eukprot:CCA20820.1 conserved hypothetical protein [Albugo laibachii Nc14]
MKSHLMSEHKESTSWAQSEKKGEDEKIHNDQSEKDVANDDTRPRHAGVGWGSEDSATVSLDEAKSDTKRGRRMRGTADSSTVKEPPKNHHFDDAKGVSDIQEIPDLEEEEREPDITTQVAEAPKNVTRSVQSLKELDRSLHAIVFNTTKLGLDLHVLTSVLCPEKMVIESDEVWTSESLLNEISSDL